MAENNSRQARAKRNVQSRMSKNSSNGSTSNGSAVSNGSLTSIEIPKVTDFKEQPEVKTQVNSLINYDGKSGATAFEVPGIPSVSFDSVGGRVKFPEFTEIDDITKPGIKNKVDQKTFDKAKLEYEGGIKYEQLAQLANKYVNEQFKTLTESYKAYAQGLMAISELEKVKQKFLDVLKQQAVTGTKAVEYIDAAHNLAITQAKLPYTVADREAKLSEARSKANRSFYSAKNAELEAMEFIASLSGENNTDTKTKAKK